jgi:hypothetical protein
LVGGVEVLEGEAADRGWGLGVEQEEYAGDFVGGFDGVLVQVPAGLVPAGLGVDGAAGAVPSGGWELQVGELVPDGPTHEVAGFAAMASVIADDLGARAVPDCCGLLFGAAGPVLWRRGSPPCRERRQWMSRVMPMYWQVAAAQT